MVARSAQLKVLRTVGSSAASSVESWVYTRVVKMAAVRAALMAVPSVAAMAA